jgi:hypothetical protein
VASAFLSNCNGKNIYLSFNLNMNTFTSIKELPSTLVREHKLLTEMFEKRKTLSYKYEFALNLVDYNEERIQFLITHSVVRQNGSFLEIDDQFLQFFE